MPRILYGLLLYTVFYTNVQSSTIHCLAPNYFKCDNGECISFLFECDGENDCGDESDEKNCESYRLTIPSATKCAEDEFHCMDELCIPAEKFCDRTADCPDKSDEYEGCVKDLKCNGFRCNDGYCIRKEWFCDGVNDCYDGSDETDCGNLIPVEKCNNTNDRYLCKNQRCIPLSATCNKKDDCGDQSDESEVACPKAEVSCEKSAHCDHFCRKTPAGAQCSCRPGYELSSDNHTCIDIDECRLYGKCDQRCINTLGSYTCICQTGYTNVLNDKGVCKVEGGEALLIYSSENEIRGLYLESHVHDSVIRNLQHVIGVSIDTNYVYWSDIEKGEEAIYRKAADGPRDLIVSTGITDVEDIAVDWITGNVYFTDDGYRHIGVCTNNGSYCTVVINEQASKPRGLALLPAHGMMYWGDWASKAHIAMAGMDGKDILPFVTENLEWPSSLSIDYPNDRLYWIDAKLKVIESIRLDGTDRRTVLHDVAKHPFSLTVFEDKLYWSDWVSNSIQSCDKFTGKDWKILAQQNTTLYGVHIYHSALKPMMPNPCNADPCSELCLLNRRQAYTCACTPDKQLNSDQHTCRAMKKKEHIVIAAGNTFIDYYNELLGKPKMTASMLMKHVTAVAYDSLTGTILAGDRLRDQIFSLDINTGKMENVMSVDNELLSGMDFDYVGNNLYSSDSQHKTIQVYSMTTKRKTMFFFPEPPFDIALVPEEGVMFVVFHTKFNKYRIDKLRMNGIDGKTTITDELLGPKVSLCYDEKSKRIYWADQGAGRIESSFLDGTNKYLFRTGLSEPVSLAILEDSIFWTQKSSPRLYWADKNRVLQSEKHVTLRVPEGLETLHLVTLHGIYANEKSSCYNKNGNCSHVCLPSNLQSHICACPLEMTLDTDGETCDEKSVCSTGEIKCGKNETCITFQQRCDGVEDCPNGEDEVNCHGESTFCEKDEFACKDGECISAKKRCNSQYDCADRSDEEDCHKKECQSNEFRCHEGNCIPKYFVCNGRNECPDFSDEINCGSRTCEPNSFICGTGNCIPKSWECDGQNDCTDGSDEGEKCQRIVCRVDMFTCRNGRCIDPWLKCNGIDDCNDNSDERDCLKKNGTSTSCGDDTYRCYNTDTCLPKTVRCNGIQDCPKNDDERDCAHCKRDEFSCDNKKCIPQNWVCDKFDDCGDKSDEKDCSGGRKSSNFNASEICEEFRCTDGTCLNFNRVCNGIPDCSDNSDEYGKCSSSCTKDNPCEHVCYKTPLGPKCVCMDGYRLDIDGKSCVDIDECENNVCSQICRNTWGSFVCSCNEGYILYTDLTSCKVAGPQMEIITAGKFDIRRISANVKSIEIIHRDQNLDINGLDVNAKEESVYWSNAVLGVISKMNVKTKELKIVTGVGRAEALSLDWTTDNVYFSDNDRPTSIKVCNLEQQKCAVLVKTEGMTSVNSIVLDPMQRYLFWSQTVWQVYDKPSTEIYRANMIGGNKTMIAYKNIGVVRGMAIDYMKSRLYWADSFLNIIEVSDFDGTNREVYLRTNDYQPLSINVYGESLYWLMGTTGLIQKCKLHDDKSCQMINIGPSNIDQYFTILHEFRQPFARNGCKDNTCDYMCIPSKDDFACVCQDGHPTKSNSICRKDLNMQVKFASSKAGHNGKNIRQESGVFVGIVVTVVIIITILSGYCYYQKIKLNHPKKSVMSIRFQNPSYDRKEAAAILTCNLPPGEHEYINPIADVSTKILEQEKAAARSKKEAHSDNSEHNEEDPKNRYNIDLLH